jgi:hypothetical protein
MRGLRSLVLAQHVDAASFAVFALLFPALMHMEMNPVIGATYTNAGVLGVVALKSGAALSITYWIRRTTTMRRTVLAAVILGAISGAIGAGGNLASLWIMVNR